MSKRNVILITIDSLRRDFLGCYGYPKNISPNIDKLAKEGILFENAYANGPNTPHAFKSIMMGKYPLEDPGYGVFEKDKYLPWIFKKNGYFTVGIQAGNPLISRYYGYGNGFDIFEDFINNRDTGNHLAKSKFKLYQKFRLIIYSINNYLYFVLMKGVYQLRKKRYQSYKDNKVPYNDVLRKLHNVLYQERNTLSKKGIFLWIHLMDTHFPYNKASGISDEECRVLMELVGLSLLPGIGAKKAIDRSLRSRIIKMYEHSVSDIDKAIGHILKILKANKIIKNASIFLVADHGELLGEHDIYTHQRSVFNELLKIPLIVYENDSPIGLSRYKGLVSQIEIYKMILASRQKNICKVITNNSVAKRNYIISEMYKNRNGRMYINEDVNMRELDRIAGYIYSIMIDNKKFIYDNSRNKLFFDLSQDPFELMPYLKPPYDVHSMEDILKKHFQSENKKRKIVSKRYELDTFINNFIYRMNSNKIQESTQ